MTAGDDRREDRHLFRDYLIGSGQEKGRLYGLGALATAAGRTPSTIRKWTHTGVIPDSPYRTAGIAGTLGDAGRRLWSQEQIEVIVGTGTEEGVLGRARPRRWQIPTSRRVCVPSGSIRAGIDSGPLSPKPLHAALDAICGIFGLNLLGFLDERSAPSVHSLVSSGNEVSQIAPSAVGIGV